MQQYSSLPEQNSQIDATPKLLSTIEQLRAELWLERSLNQLQSRLNDCLLSANDTVLGAKATEAEIFHTLVNELDLALNNSKVAIALLQPQAKIAQVCFVSRCPYSSRQASVLKVMPKKRKSLQLRLHEVIPVEVLQRLEKQQPPNAWLLTDDSDGVIGWLLITKAPPRCSFEILTASQARLKSQLMLRSSQLFAKTLRQLRQIQSLQEQAQNLLNTNQELERTNQLKNQFLANTSHEIRTPLSSVIGFTHLLLAQGYDPGKERHKEYLNIIQSSGKHLLALINDILDLSKIEANQLEVEYEKVNLAELCHNVLALVKEKAANKGLKLRLELDPNLKFIIADSLRLKQMLLNLLFNALKFTSTGAVGLQVFPKDEFVHFTVWDTGTGISQTDLSQLFQPYVQIANSVTQRHEGTGLGLTVTQKLAEIHGGWVEVESEINQGSRFTIILPLKAAEWDEGDQEDEEVSSSLPTVSLAASSSSQIMLVEDDLYNAELMQIYLTKLGHQVTWVKNATEMWEFLTEFKPAVILMDIHLLDENGLNLVQQLRAKQQYQTIPIIAQTAMATKGDREICLASGVNDYISKPIDLPVLASLVAKYSQRGAERGNTGG